MSSASAHVAAPGGGDLAMQGEGGGEGQQGEMGSSGRDARDPVTGEGIWVDEEDEVCACVFVYDICVVGGDLSCRQHRSRRNAHQYISLHINMGTHTGIHLGKSTLATAVLGALLCTST